MHLVFGAGAANALSVPAEYYAAIAHKPRKFTVLPHTETVRLNTPDVFGRAWDWAGDLSVQG
jgi:hypothetical protein